MEITSVSALAPTSSATDGVPVKSIKVSEKTGGIDPEPFAEVTISDEAWARLRAVITPADTARAEMATK